MRTRIWHLGNAAIGVYLLFCALWMLSRVLGDLFGWYYLLAEFDASAAMDLMREEPILAESLLYTSFWGQLRDMLCLAREVEAQRAPHARGYPLAGRACPFSHHPIH